MYKAALRLSDDKGFAYEIFSVESLERKYERSKIIFSKNKGTLKIDIHADDYTALKSTLWPVLKQMDLIMQVNKFG